MIRLVDVSKVYNAGRDNAFVAVDGVSLTIAAGTVTALQGPSGSGKTTLLCLAGCMARPSSGRIFLEDTELTSLPSRISTIRSITGASRTRGSWLAMRMVVPRAFSRPMLSMNSRDRVVSRWAVGSSAMSTAGVLISARAMAVRCASPPESHSTRADPLPANPSRSSRARARWRTTAWGSPVG